MGIGDTTGRRFPLGATSGVGCRHQLVSVPTYRVLRGLSSADDLL